MELSGLTAVSPLTDVTVAKQQFYVIFLVNLV